MPSLKPLATAKPPLKANNHLAWSFIFNVQGGVLLTQPKPGLWSVPVTPANDQPALAAYRQAIQLTGNDLEPVGHLPTRQMGAVETDSFVFLSPGLIDHLQGSARWFTAQELMSLKRLLPSKEVFPQAALLLENPTVDFVLARDRPDTLTREQLLETVSWLHIMGMEDSEVYAAVAREMGKRRLKDPDAALDPKPDNGEFGKRPNDLADSSPLAKSLDLPDDFIVVPSWASLAPPRAVVYELLEKSGTLADASQGVMIALAIPKSVTEQLAGLVKNIKHAELVTPDQMHVTLTYFGKTDEVPFEQDLLERIVKNFAEAHAPLKGKIGGLGRFHGDGERGALFAILDCKDLIDLRAELLQVLDGETLLPDETHGFTAHITLAYLPVKEKVNLSTTEIPVTCTQLICGWGSDQWTKYPLNAQALAKSETDPYLIPPPDQGEYKFVVQHHYRGKGAHADLRFEHGSFLIGWTLLEQVAGALKTPVTTLSEARAADAAPGNWKIDWSTGEIHNLRAVEKRGDLPRVWLKAQGLITGAEPGEMNAPSEVNVLSIVDKGVVEYGAQDALFHEYFLHGGSLTGRLLFRRIEPGSTDPKGWLVMQPADQTPYVLSEGALKKKWLPLHAFSALPKQIREKVAPSMQFWKMDGAAALAARAALVEHWKEMSGPEMRTAEEGGIQKRNAPHVVQLFQELPIGASVINPKTLPQPIAKADPGPAPSSHYTIQLPPIHVNLPAQAAPQIHIDNHLPAQAAPTIQVAAPNVQVTNEIPAAQVQVTNQVQPAAVQVTNEVATPSVTVNQPPMQPQITVNVPEHAAPQVTVNVPEPKSETLDVERNPEGLITRVIKSFVPR